MINLQHLALGACIVGSFGPIAHAQSTTETESSTRQPPRSDAQTERQIQRKVEEAKTNMRVLATGIETYYVDNNSYPAFTDHPQRSTLKQVEGGKKVPSFLLPTGQSGNMASPMTLTTPISYIRNYTADPFAARLDDTFAYYVAGPSRDETGWILFSPGPDRKFDLDWTLYDPTKSNPLQPLAPFTYDPSNGTTSSGDILRIRQ